MTTLLRFCRDILILSGVAALAMIPLIAVSAGPLESVAIDRGATVIHPEKTVMVPVNGAVGSDISISSRAFLSIDFAVQAGKQVTLLVITDAQKREMNAGKPITGRPRVRAPIDGTASQSLTVSQGGYYVAILNSDSQPVSVTYRVCARAF
ncbi:MAG: hypothetical protein KA801_15825 [Syntrophorhabdaceae bacterium]|nr:hypothetical protein [Syntrophorhabdaceae bacterium]